MEVVCGKLKTKTCSERQFKKFTKPLRVTIVLTLNGALRENLISVLQEIFAIINKSFDLAGTLGAWLSFPEV